PRDSAPAASPRPVLSSLRPLGSPLGGLGVTSFSVPVLVTTLFLYVLASLFPAACSHPATPMSCTITFLLESNPANLDPRFATDAQSQHIDGLLFSSLLERDAEMNLHGDFAESWDIPDPVTYVFHLRSGVHFHDGRALTSADVKSTF